MLTTSEHSALIKGLANAFSKETDLEEITYTYLNENLDDIAPGVHRTERITNLVRWADTQDRVADLLDAAERANPGNPTLRAVTVDLRKMHGFKPQPLSPAAAQTTALIEALLSAFRSPATLSQMAYFGLNMKLDSLVGPSSLRTQVRVLIQWAVDQGKLGALVAAAQEANPDNPQLQDYIHTYGYEPDLTTTGFTTPPPVLTWGRRLWSWWQALWAAKPPAATPPPPRIPPARQSGTPAPRNAQPPKLTQEQRRTLHHALLDAFPNRQALAELAQAGLDQNLARIAYDHDLNTAVLDLVEYAVAHDQVDVLIQVASQLNPDNLAFHTLMRHEPVLHQPARRPPSRYTQLTNLLAQSDYQALFTAVLAAFPRRAEVEILMRVGLAENLDQIIFGTNQQDVWFEVLNWAQAKGVLGNLVTALEDHAPVGSSGQELHAAITALIQHGAVQLT
ncbi:MAG: effector-associated domain EAD1-containing protein [Chloroflexota bacterium]|nr:effector-associated domain EAD1-containing protein [Chloroflexota bacterium]